MSLFGGKSTGSREYTAIYAPSIVEKISYGDLQFFKVGRGGWRRDVRPSRGLGGPGSVVSEILYNLILVRSIVLR